MYLARLHPLRPPLLNLLVIFLVKVLRLASGHLGPTSDVRVSLLLRDGTKDDVHVFERLDRWSDRAMVEYRVTAHGLTLPFVSGRKKAQMDAIKHIDAKKKN